LGDEEPVEENDGSEEAGDDSAENLAENVAPATSPQELQCKELEARQATAQASCSNGVLGVCRDVSLILAAKLEAGCDPDRDRDNLIHKKRQVALDILISGPRVSRDASLAINSTCVLPNMPRTRGVCIGESDESALNKHCSPIAYQDAGHDLHYSKPSTDEWRVARYVCPGFGSLDLYKIYNSDTGQLTPTIVNIYSVVCVPRGSGLSEGSPLSNLLAKRFGPAAGYAGGSTYNTTIKPPRPADGKPYYEYQHERDLSISVEGSLESPRSFEFFGYNPIPLPDDRPDCGEALYPLFLSMKINGSSFYDATEARLKSLQQEDEQKQLDEKVRF
jgi:hypothetical protein